MSLRLYFTRAFSLIDMTDYIPATLKTMVFGFIIATMSSYLGFNTESGTEGVGRASTQCGRAVVDPDHRVNVILVRLIFFLFPEAAAVMTRRRRARLGAACARSRFGIAQGARRRVASRCRRGCGFVILGRSGTGKSVTLRHIVGARPAGRGTVFVDDDGDQRAQRDGACRGCGAGSASCFRTRALFDSISVGENVAFPLRRHTN